ncbi:MAG: zinc ribbon domain-containing protein [Gemmataceae bacterium]|nr:zinc ribbon domain-containing protein [Gemmataceae bacterium]
MLYASELIRCGHCQHPVTGEKKVKKTKAGDREYVYYRCTKYTAAGHPRTRLPESTLDEQVLALFAKLRVDDEEVRDWFVSVLRAKTHDEQREARERLADLTRQLSARPAGPSAQPAADGRDRPRDVQQQVNRTARPRRPLEGRDRRLRPGSARTGRPRCQGV